MSQEAYRKWRSAHRGKRPSRYPWKKVHRWRIGGWWHVWRVRRRFPEDQYRMAVYPCRWTDDYREGEIGRQHWHVGRDNRWEVDRA